MSEDLTYLEIAHRVLSRELKIKSVHYKDVAKRAFDLELIESDDIIVAGNIASAINSDIRKSSTQGTESKFVAYGKGFYGLAEHEPKGIFADISKKNKEVKARLLEALHAMPPAKFEELTGEVLRKLGFAEVQVTGKTGDGGIDVTGVLVVAGVIKSNVSVQVKRWRNNVQRSTVSELRGSLRPHQSGLLITTSDFSRQAYEEANDPYKAPISLMGGLQLVDIMCDFGIGVATEKVTILEIEDTDVLLDIPEQVNVDEKGIEIFANYKNHKHYAVYFSPTKILYNNEYYKSPSKAGSMIMGTQVNGWRFWKYRDAKTGKDYPLERLRDKS